MAILAWPNHQELTTEHFEVEAPRWRTGGKWQPMPRLIKW